VPSAANKGCNNYGILTFLEKARSKFEGLRSGGPTFVLGESVQPLQGILDVIFSSKFPYKFLCDTWGQTTNSA
jgi:hypothetical protein